jgi:multidrug efflux pump subunit AcrB
MIVVTLAGLSSYFGLGRNEDPAFTFRTMVVQAAWPGATLDDTLKQDTERIERKLQETRGLDFLRSYTTPGLTTIFVNLKGSTSASEVPDVWYQVRKNVGDIRHTLPAGVVGPGFNDDFGDTFGLIYGFSADGFTHRELRDYVEAVRSRLLNVPDVSKIEIIGAQDEQIYIEFSTQQLAGLGIDRAALIAAVQAQNSVVPAGSVQTSDEKLQLRVSGDFRSEQDILNVNFLSNGRMIRLRDIAEVRRAYADPPQPMFRVNGQPAIGIGIAMREGGDILTLGRDVTKAMAEMIAKLPLGIEVHLVASQSDAVSYSFNEFMKTLCEAIVIVMVVSLISLGLRAGAVVALSIPLVLAVVFIVMEVIGIGFQRVSLGALIVALGLLVDDAMITVESMVTKLEEGWEKARAATYAYATTHFPMGTGTLVTVAGFLPIGLAQSNAGEYAFSLFAVVAIALIVSWFVAAIFTPVIGMGLLLEKKSHGYHAPPGRVLRLFRAFLLRAMRARWVTIGATLGLFALSVVGATFVPQQFFPASDRPELMVDLRLRHDASIYAAEKAVVELDAILRQDPDVEHRTSYVGRGALHFYLPQRPELPNDFFAQTVIVTKNLAARERVRERLQEVLRERFSGILGRVYPLETGPPVGWPLQYRVSGPNPRKVREIAYELAQVMGNNPYADSINFDWIEPAKIIQIELDQDQARSLGLSSETLAQTLNGLISGISIMQLRDGVHLIDVVARTNENERLSLVALRNLQIPLPDGRTIPLIQIATLKYIQEPPLMWRRDRLPTLTVQADVVSGIQPDTVTQALRSKIADLNSNLADGYRIVVGGATEENTSSQRSVVAVVPLMLLVMLLILMVQLRSFHRLFLVLSVAPLGLIGVVGALLIANKPLGFIALLGVIALIGMIIRNSVILVIQIEREIAAGHPQWDAVIEATTNRVRPIMLTAGAAILGMIPIAPTVFWGPMAFAIMGGLAVATVLTLVFLPALYVAWFRVKGPVLGA